MATLYGVNADRILVDKPPQHSKVGEDGGVVRLLRDEFELTADLSSADVIYMGAKLPKGARILDLHLYFDDLDTSGGTLDVGWLASEELDSSGSAVEALDADGIMADVDVASASDCIKATNGAAAQLAKWVEKKFEADVQIAITVDGDTDATSGTILMNLFYVVD